MGEQGQRCDAVARRFRAYTDGRVGAGPGVVLMGYEPTVEVVLHLIEFV